MVARQRPRHAPRRTRRRLARHVERALTGEPLTRLAVRSWGDPAAPRVVCVHGITGHGRHFERLAERLVPSFHVLAPDLIGHADSPYEPPWSIAAHIDALCETLGPTPAAWIGHSFGARLVHEIAAGRPESVERIVHLDPAIMIPPPVALFAGENALKERVYDSFEDGVAGRYEESSLRGAPRELLEAELSDHLVRSADGGWRYRYSQAAVVAAYGEMASTPAPFSSTRMPTLLVLGEHSYLSYDHLLDEHRGALGDLLEVVIVDGGHTVLWDAFDETAGAIERFLADSLPAG